MTFAPNDPRLKKVAGMEPDEAYAEYLAFCKENGMKAASKDQFLAFNHIWTASMEPTK
jgi:hypothetical protein